MPGVKLLMLLVLGMMFTTPCFADTVPTAPQTSVTAAAVTVHETVPVLPQTDMPPADSQVVKLELKDADIRDVLIALGKQAGVNIVADPTLQGKVTMHLENIPLTVALDALVNPYGYVVERQGTLLMVKKPGVQPTIQAELGPTGSLFLHARQAELRDVLQEIARVAKMSVLPRPGVQGVVTIDLVGVPVNDAIRTLAANFGYEMSFDSGVCVVAPPVVPPPPEPEAPPAPPVPAPPVVRCDSGMMTIDVHGMEIKTLLDLVARAAGVNIVAASDVAGSIDLYIDKLPLEQMLDNFLITQGLSYRRADGVFRVFKNAATQTTPAAFNVTYTDSKVTVDVTDADLGQLLAEISAQSGNDLIVFGSLRDKVNVRLTAVPLDQALDLILAGTRWSAQRRDNIILVGEHAASASTAGLMTQTRLFTLKHLKVTEVTNLLPASFANATIKILPEQNALVARGTRLEMEELADYIDRIDQAPPVIMIDVLVVEYSNVDGFDRSLTLQATSDDGSNDLTLSPGAIKGTIDISTFNRIDEQFTATLSMLESEGAAQVRANPRMAALSGHEATINVGTEEYFKVTTGNVETPLTQLEKISSGIMLTITPWSSDESDRITVKLQAEVSSPGQVNSEGLPAISTRKASTELAVRDGQTIVIGGLIDARESNTEERVPWIGKIPILGWFFSSDLESSKKSELVFYITPHLQRAGDTPLPAGTASDSIVISR